MNRHVRKMEEARRLAAKLDVPKVQDDSVEPPTTSMRLRPEDHAVLRECRRLSGLSRTDVIRQALKLYLAKLRREAKNLSQAP